MEDVAAFRRSHTAPFLSTVVPAYEKGRETVEISQSHDVARGSRGDRQARTQAIPMHGWGWEFAVEKQRRALPHQLADGKPALADVGREVRPFIERRSPETSAFLSANYTLIKQDAFGGFHARRMLHHPDDHDPERVRQAERQADETPRAR